MVLYLVMVGLFFIYIKKSPKKNKYNPPHKIKEKSGNSSKTVDEKQRKKNKKDKIVKDSTTPFNNITPNSSKETFKKFNRDESDHDDNNWELPYHNIIIKTLKKKQIILSIIDNKNKKRIFYIVLLISIIINYIGINTFFMSENNIHQIYLDKNIYNFGKQFKYIIISLFISRIIFCLPKLCSNKDVIKNNIIYIILFSISFIVFIFYWIYVGSVTSLYINSKRHLLLNIIICLLFDIIFDVILTLIIATSRYKIKNKIIANIIEYLLFI